MHGLAAGKDITAYNQDLYRGKQMDKLYGWTGKLLRADLSAGTVTTMDTQAYLPTYVGGLGIAARIAWASGPCSPTRCPDTP